MQVHQEGRFETEICEHLAANGWLHSPDGAGYDKRLALFPEDVFGWLEDTQPDEFAKVVKVGTPGERKERERLLERLRKVLDTPHEKGGGTVKVLRKGFATGGATFVLAQFRPEHGKNPAVVENYQKMRLRVVQQVRYSTGNTNAIDLVLFLNGIPVATVELKTDFTQSIADAIAQYQNDRNPKGEPLLTPVSGAVVHFAVSSSDVYMTTKLAGVKTRFLPFNLGVDGGAGNPVNARGASTAYLWERVLERDNWLDILGKFVFVTQETTIDPISGERSTQTKTMFPRLHQWDVVTQLVDTTRVEGPGNRYLVQHSAGSGKTGSISWTAHRLAKLHDEADNPVFDSVIVITDRTVLDSQLQTAIREIEPGAGFIATIDDKAIRDAGQTSKSKVLAAELLKGTRIIVVTIQTFPFAMDAIRSERGLAGKRFAVIADEAHSSQTGETANKLRAVLTAEQIEELEDGGEFDTEAVLAAEVIARAESPNISYYAFTATPKAKTLEVFGRENEDGVPVAFHVYTMKQAIEEGYILDVLRGYQTYQLAFKIANSGSGDGDDEVDQANAAKRLVRWVQLHPTNIEQRVKIVVEHFRENVAHLLEGHAKAMVVTDSRKAAVRYKLAIDKYIESQGYDIGTLVAFSGSVTDDESGPDPFTEASMNPDVRGRDLAAAFATGEFQIMLVANKYQTGFDQPLLSAMYVFKRLDGVAAVQTLSRLNRTYTTPSGERKETTIVLDFVNKPDDIQEAFRPYYLDAHVETGSDRDIVHDLRSSLDEARIYTQDEINKTADIYVKAGYRSQAAAHNALTAAISPAKKRFGDAHKAAKIADDKAELARLEKFRHDAAAFVRVYDFMSQIEPYGPELEKYAIYLRLLNRLLEPNSTSDDVDLSGVTLKAVDQIAKGSADISLTPKGLKGITGVGDGTVREPKMVAMQAVIDRLNELFGDESLTADQTTTFVEGLLRALLANDRLVQQAAVNEKQQFLESPDLADSILDAVAGNQDAANRMSDVFYGGNGVSSELIRQVGILIYEWARAGDDDANDY